ncbi:hypothetical protein BU056_12740 [Staphylococcus succinus]|nr:hypothetical protein BU056_12740 [Staphylococcus succinus]
MSRRDIYKGYNSKKELQNRIIYVDNLDYENLGTHAFKNYCITIHQAMDKSGVKWHKNDRDPYEHYIFKLDEIRIELDYYIAFSYFFYKAH